MNPARRGQRELPRVAGRFRQRRPDNVDKVLADDQVAIKIPGDVTRGPSSPLNAQLMHTGATGGRFLRAVGIPSYGVQGFFFDRADMRMHGRDERMPVKSF